MSNLLAVGDHVDVHSNVCTHVPLYSFHKILRSKELHNTHVASFEGVQNITTDHPRNRNFALKFHTGVPFALLLDNILPLRIQGWTEKLPKMAEGVSLKAKYISFKFLEGLVQRVPVGVTCLKYRLVKFGKIGFLDW